MYEYWNIDWLAHHGIDGQRWGHRNGPPYPLSSDVSTGSRLKKGATGSIKKKTPKSGSGRITKGTADKSFDKEWAEVQKQSAYDDVKDWLKEIYLEDNFDGYFDGENPMPGTKGIDEWGDRELISQAKYRLDESGRGKNLSDKEIKQALIDAWNEHYNLPSENPKDKKDNPITSKEKSKIPADKVYVKRPDNLSEVKLSKEETKQKKDDKSWIDKHTITRESKSQTSTPRFGEVNKDGKIIRTQSDLINEAVERGLAENRRRRQNAVNSEQDMFNDMLYNVRYGSDKKNDTKDYEKNLKRVAKEYKVNWKDLKKDVEDNFNKRESEIEKSQKSNNKEMINRRLQNAKTRDQWDINFLEAVQNKPFTEQHITGDISDSAYKNKMLQEYKKYLEDPEKYWNSR